MQLADYIDHTILKPEATKEDVKSLCKEAIAHNFKAVCINPCFVPFAKEQVFGSQTLVCTVIGFPLGANKTEIKLAETAQAIADGADEIDMVINIGLLKQRDLDAFKDDIEQVLLKCRETGKVLKVILETALLNEEEIRLACGICKDLKVDFVKTSTGFASGGATMDAVRIMRESVGPDMGVKASGGIKTKEDALNMISVGATRIGTSSGVAIIS